MMSPSTANGSIGCISCCLLSVELCRAQLRQQRETIEGLVDDVVECYHNGFAKAIHNYSQILQLFSDSRAHVRSSSSSSSALTHKLSHRSVWDAAVLTITRAG